MKLNLFFIMMFLTSLITSIALAKKKPKEYNAVVYSDHVRYKGFIEKVSDKGITIDYMGKSKFISAESITRIKVKRKNALTTSVLITSVAGLIGGSALYVYEQNQKTVNASAIPVIVVGSTLVGGGIGAIINTFTCVKTYNRVNQNGNFKKIQLELVQYSEAYLSKK